MSIGVMCILEEPIPFGWWEKKITRNGMVGCWSGGWIIELD